MRSLSLLPLLALAAAVAGSAIPMWEYLNRGEKMNLLYNMLTMKVKEYCETTKMPDCNTKMLIHGYKNLAKMEDSSLNRMDPYQRGASDLIWGTMMKGGVDSHGETASHPADYHSEHNESDDGNIGSQGAASTNVHQYLPTESQGYLMGPMVMKLLPNGNPVPGEQQFPIVRDEDAEEMKLMQYQYSPPPEDILKKSS
ncbi:rhythmically expressed gene 5 protein [Schistocerca gregaria]|uniref:rhythmically expressed gene 5 protein n=1 Tax=Schistocerca gregaria TaxID=7010 RepID=UPI00211EE8D5|nr:rhythmically expressed gene 5 protein [Schistocerca gregaria]